MRIKRKLPYLKLCLQKGGSKRRKETSPLINLYLDYVLRIFFNICAQENIKLPKFDFQIIDTARNITLDNIMDTKVIQKTKVLDTLMKSRCFLKLQIFKRQYYYWLIFYVNLVLILM